MDVVWLKLTDLKGKEDFFMFGPTGVVRFKRVGAQTELHSSRGGEPQYVQEDEAYIMNTIAKIRNTSPKGKAKK